VFEIIFINSHLYVEIKNRNTTKRLKV